MTKYVLRKAKLSKICDCSEVLNNLIWHPTRPEVLMCACHQHPHDFCLSPMESIYLIRGMMMVIKVPLSCSGNLLLLLQICRPSWTSTGGFQSLTLIRFACIFCNKFYFCNPTPSFAAHHKHSHQPAVRRSSWVQGDSSGRRDVHLLPVWKLQGSQQLQVDFCRSSFVSFNLCGKPRTHFSFFSLKTLLYHRYLMNPLIKYSCFVLNHDTQGPNSLCRLMLFLFRCEFVNQSYNI